jgi:hydroxymethylbilane synthase
MIERKILKLGTRPSQLALRQVEEIKKLFAHIDFEVITYSTRGDKDKITPISEVEGSDFFTREIDDALIEGKIDAAVHSAKDLEDNVRPGLVIVALTPSISPYECLVSRTNLRLAKLVAGALIGTSSKKRKIAVKQFRNDLAVKDIRGTIDERLEQLDRGAYDAIIVAHAALIRLGYENRISQILSPEIIQPHPLQGRLAVQIRADRVELHEIFRRLK